jgi:hypothetical protein
MFARQHNLAPCSAWRGCMPPFALPLKAPGRHLVSTRQEHSVGTPQYRHTDNMSRMAATQAW